jgi:biopolymer transport protein ExbD
MISFVIEIIPILTVLLVLGFFILIALVFMTKDIATFAKPLGWTIFILSLIFIVGSAFGSFAPLEHMLPHTSDAHLNEGLEQLKDFIYSSAFKDGIIFVISVIVVGFFLLKK